MTVSSVLTTSHHPRIIIIVLSPFLSYMTKNKIILWGSSAPAVDVCPMKLRPKEKKIWSLSWLLADRYIYMSSEERESQKEKGRGVRESVRVREREEKKNRKRESERGSVHFFNESTIPFT